jgi:hypothetical protein
MHPSCGGAFGQADWRSSRCDELITQKKRPSRRLDDKWTWKSWRFLHALSLAEDMVKRELIRRRSPALAAALDVRKGDDFRRWHLEAMLLSREPVDAVARRFGLTAEGVEAYAKLYFDVRDHLDADCWIILGVIGITPGRRFTEKDAEAWMKLFGYRGGVHALDAVVEYYQAAGPVPDVLTGNGPTARLKRLLSTRAAILARCVPDGDPRMVLLARLNDLLDARRGGGGELTPVPAHQVVLEGPGGP